MIKARDVLDFMKAIGYGHWNGTIYYKNQHLVLTDNIINNIIKNNEIVKLTFYRDRWVYQGYLSVKINLKNLYFVDEEGKVKGEDYSAEWQKFLSKKQLLANKSNNESCEL